MKTIFNWKAGVSSAAIMAIAVLSSPALAQQAADSADGSSEGEIVVTAQKSKEALSKAPVAVSVVSQEALNRQGLTTAEQLATTAPSLKLSQNGFQIRGIGSNNAFSGYSTVATQFDGIYNPSSAALSLALFDVGSIEVLRGPQGTVYGRNATAGIVNINTADPGRDLGGSASLQFGRFNEIKAQAAVDLPIADTLRVRIAGFRQVSDGFGPKFAGDRFDKQDVLGVRATAIWEIAPTLTWRVSGSYGENRSTVPATYMTNYTYYPSANLVTGVFGPATTVQTNEVYPGLNLVTDNRQDLKSYDVRSRLVWEPTQGLSLTYLAGYSNIVNNGVVASTGVFSQEYLAHKTNAWSHELDLNYESGPFKLVAGGYIYKDEQPSGLRLLHAGNTAPAPFSTVFNIAGPLVAGTGNRPSTIAAVDVVNRYSGTGSKSRAIFGQVTFKPVESLRLTAGIRSTWDEAINHETELVCAPGGLFTRATVSSTTCPGFPLAFTDDRLRASAKYSKVSWRLGADFDLTPDILAYGTVSTGYRGGGLQPSTNPVAYRQYGPETVTNFEAGLRANLMDRKLFIGLTAYQMDYKDLQVSSIIVDPIRGVTPVTTNAAKARIRGVELETTFRPTPSDRFSGYISIMDSKFLAFPNAPDNLRSADVLYNILAPIFGFAPIPTATANFSGNQLANAPKFSARASYSHSFELSSGAKITPSVDFYYQSSTFATASNDLQGRIGSYTKTDLNIQYDDPSGHFYVNLFVNNVENSRINTLVVPVWSSTTTSYAPPRTYGVRVGFNF